MIVGSEFMIVDYVGKVLDSLLQSPALVGVECLGTVEQDLKLAGETLAEKASQYRRHFLVEFPPGVLENGTQHEEVESLIDIGKVVAAFAKPGKERARKGEGLVNQTRITLQLLEHKWLCEVSYTSMGERAEKGENDRLPILLK